MSASCTALNNIAVHLLQTREVHGPVPPELWRSIAASLALSPAQQQNCVLVHIISLLWVYCPLCPELQNLRASQHTSNKSAAPLRLT